MEFVVIFSKVSVNWTPENEPLSAIHLKIGIQSEHAKGSSNSGPFTKIKIDNRMLSHVVKEPRDSEGSQEGLLPEKVGECHCPFREKVL